MHRTENQVTILINSIHTFYYLRAGHPVFFGQFLGQDSEVMPVTGQLACHHVNFSGLLDAFNLAELIPAILNRLAEC